MTRAKAKFPLARIKKIMQADEEVGKVAQATPILMSKALEIFLRRLIEAAVATVSPSSKSSIRVGLENLKKAIENKEEFDFLLETIGKSQGGDGSVRAGYNEAEQEELDMNLPKRPRSSKMKISTILNT